MSSAVSIENLGKRFRRVSPGRQSLIGRLRRTLSSDEETRDVWALRGVTLDVARGACLAISGPNGAGKTTLLKLISGIFAPSEGRIVVTGKTNAFFQIGAGFQRDLSVRDNVEIAGILMGLTRHEILDRMDTILGFSGLDRVSNIRAAELSAGQQARMAVSTALHTDLDILLIDEILSVGDADFRERCLSAFEKIRAAGKTVLIASHDEVLLERVGTERLEIADGRARILK